MSLLRRGHQVVTLALMRQSSIRYFRAAPVALTASRTQNGFAGLDNCFIWDDKHGFGYNKQGEVVIVTPDTYSDTSQMFSSDIHSTLPELEETPESQEIPETDDGDDLYPASAGGKC